MEQRNPGKHPQPPRREDASHIEYMTEVRNFAIRSWFPEIAGEVGGIAAQAGMPAVIDADQYARLAPEIDRSPAVAGWKRVMRSQQQLAWQKLQDSYAADREFWEGRLTEAEERNPGRLHCDPDFHVPESACEDIHLQPGGYCGDNLAGFVFYHGTRVFYQGDNDKDEIHEACVDDMRLPADGQVRRILDLGCSIGQCTTVLKERHPQAEVWGLDVALPMLRYAHMRATDMGVDVHFQQALAENMQHDDDSFDAVLAYILFHEVPEHTFEPIVREMLRVLRPGGTLTVIDTPNSTVFPTPNWMWKVFDARYNCEPYSQAFGAFDFAALLDKVGFEDVSKETTNTFLLNTLATKPG